MIEIITKDGISLDLCPDDEFQIEYESPLFTDDHIPVPWSTDIGFLPTPTNCEVFDYLKYELEEPKVKDLAATIYFAGIPLLSGTLTYSGIEDGRINYSFAGKDLEKTLSNYAHETEYENIVDVIDFTNGAKGFGTNLREAVTAARNGDYSAGFALPPIIHSDFTGDSNVDDNIKFRNHPYIRVPEISPAVLIKRIFADACAIDLDISPSLLSIYSCIAILGLYRPIDNAFGFSKDDRGNLYYHLNPYENLPEIRIYDLLVNILRILCASLWRDGFKYKVIGNSEIIKSADIEDWEDKITDTFSLSTEAAINYLFKYSNSSSSESSFNPEDNGEIITTDNCVEAILTAGTKNYKAIRDGLTGDCFSLKIQKTGDNYITLSSDIIYQDNGNVEAEDNKKDTYSAIVDFNLVKCTPIALYDDSGDGEQWIFMAPVLGFPALDGKRPTDVYIGVLPPAGNAANQITDKSCYFSPINGRIASSSGRMAYLKNHSISPKDLLSTNGLHYTYAEWIKKNRASASVGLNLTPMDIVSLRLYHKVYFNGKCWVIKKISITFNIKTGTHSATGDFVEA